MEPRQQTSALGRKNECQPESCPSVPVLAATSRVVLAACVVAGWFYLHSSFIHLGRSSSFLISFLVMCLWRFKRGGIAEVKREVVGLLSDFSGPFIAVVRAYDRTWITAYVELCCSLSRLSCYLIAYGILSQTGMTLFVAPIIPLLFVLTYEGQLLVVGQFLALVFGFWQYFNWANNLSFHRYFSHRCLSTSRLQTFLLGLLGVTGGQRGPLWWSSTHRRHHKHCETSQDPHCPSLQGFWYAHCGWIMDRDNFGILPSNVRDWVRQSPELLLIDAFNVLLYGAFVSMMPTLVQSAVGSQGLDLSVSKVMWLDTEPNLVTLALPAGLSVSLHFEFLINSWCHSWEKPTEVKASEASKDSSGTPEDPTLDVHGSKQAAAWKPCKGEDHMWVGLLNAGEGFHAGHHEDGSLAQHGHHWFQDTAYMGICVLEALGLVWGVQRKKNQVIKEA